MSQFCEFSVIKTVEMGPKWSKEQGEKVMLAASCHQKPPVNGTSGGAFYGVASPGFSSAQSSSVQDRRELP